MNNLIKERLKEKLLELVKDKAPLKDSWGQQQVFVGFPNGLQWKHPVSVEQLGWESISKFSGEASLVLIDDPKSKLELLEVMAVINKPLKFQLDENSPTGKLGVSFTWQFNQQKETFDENYGYVHLIGTLQGFLYRKE